MSSSKSKPDKPTTAELDVIETLLKYPALEKIFDRGYSDGYEKTKRTMSAVIAELERVIRRGTKQDAEKAEKILDAYNVALKFLGELEQIRKKQTK